MKNWFTLSEAAEVSGLGNTTIRSKIKSGELKAVKRPSKHGTRWEIPRDALVDFVNEQPQFEADDLGGLRGVTLNPRPSEVTEASDRSEGLGGVSESFEASETIRGHRSFDGALGEQLRAFEVIQQALSVAEKAREDRMMAFREKSLLQEENERLKRQLVEVQMLLGTERRLLAENSESLVEKEAALAQQKALREKQAEEVRNAREKAEEEAHRARAEALEIAAKLEKVEEESRKASMAILEAEQAKSELESLKTEMAAKEAAWTEKRKPWYKKLFSVG